MKPLDWRGGKVVYNRTATLVSATNLLSEWACDIAVNRPGLWATFPANEDAGDPAEAVYAAARTPRKKPGPAPDPDWPAAIAKVTKDSVAAGYARPLKRGEKAAIQAMLLSAMAENNKHPSDDSARKYADQVIVQLPDISTA